jgi:hypothetical protein
MGSAKCKRCPRRRRATVRIEEAMREALNGLPAVEDLDARHEELFRRSFVLVAELSGVCEHCAGLQLADVLVRSRGLPGVPAEVALV